MSIRPREEWSPEGDGKKISNDFIAIYIYIYITYICKLGYFFLSLFLAPLACKILVPQPGIYPVLPAGSAVEPLDHQGSPASEVLMK